MTVAPATAPPEPPKIATPAPQSVPTPPRVAAIDPPPGTSVVERPVAAQPAPQSAPAAPAVVEPAPVAAAPPPTAEKPVNSPPRPLRAPPKPGEKPSASAPPAAAAPEKLAALPPPTAIPHTAPATANKSQITVIRGGRHVVLSRKGSIEHRKLAALPPNASHARTATDAPPIVVLRGRAPRYTLAARVEPTHAPEPAVLTVIRGARPQPARLVPYVQPGPLILHIPAR